MRVVCPYCTRDAELVFGDEIYNGDFVSLRFWLCRKCDAYVGTHRTTIRPLGTLANKELREWRKRTHAYIDRVWKEGKMPRNVMYKKLSEVLGREIHVGESDIEQCKSIMYAAAMIFKL